MATTEEKARRIFGERAEWYTTSAAHTDPQTLQRLVEVAAPAPHWAALDLATGTGHTAFALAPVVATVVATDLTPQMLGQAAGLRAARGVHNVRLSVADAHRLPFPAGAFQLVTCRRAAHHFSNVMQALAEMRRVLDATGRLVIDDRSQPEDDFVDACINQLERWHDESHVRQYRVSEWQRFLAAAGFRVDVVDTYVRHRPLSLVTAGVSSTNVARIRATLDGLDDAQRAALNYVRVDGEWHYNHWYVLIGATRV